MKKWLAILLCALMVLSLAACAKKEAAEVEDEEAADYSFADGDQYDQIGGEPQVGQMAAAGGNLLFVEEVDGARITRVLVKLANELTEEHEEIV
jgi:predicted small lipoprotein YifL